MRRFVVISVHLLSKDGQSKNGHIKKTEIIPPEKELSDANLEKFEVKKASAKRYTIVNVTCHYLDPNMFVFMFINLLISSVKVLFSLLLVEAFLQGWLKAEQNSGVTNQLYPYL